MSSARKVLLVVEGKVEGKVAEKKLLERALDCYDVGARFKFFPYRSNIDMLYNDICDEDGSIPDDLDTMQVLVERERKLKVPSLR